jgi:hypothetical protein
MTPTLISRPMSESLPCGAELAPPPPHHPLPPPILFDSNSDGRLSSHDPYFEPRDSLLRTFLQFAHAEPVPKCEDWFTIPKNLDQILEDFQASHPQTWDALPKDLRFVALLPSIDSANLSCL